MDHDFEISVTFTDWRNIPVDDEAMKERISSEVIMAMTLAAREVAEKFAVSIEVG